MMEAELTNGKFTNLKKKLQLQKSTILDLIDYFFENASPLISTQSYMY